MSGVDGVSAFLTMGGYGAFVWPAFGLTAVVLVGLLIASLRSLRSREADLRAIQAGRRGVRRPSGEVARET